MASFNIKSAYDNAWSPEFFGCESFDSKLTKAIKDFQRENGLTVDGLCGKKTVALLKKNGAYPMNNKNYIYCGPKAVEIKWDKVIIWTEKYAAKKYRANYDDRQPRLFINHWDAALSSASCHKILSDRGLSCHFLIDNDGTIIQCANTSHITYHAGNSNRYSIGCEISNAYYTRYQDRYISKGYGERPIIKNAYVHGKKMRDHLGFYPVQLEALKALWVAISSYYDIPIDTPADENGNEITTLYNPAFSTYKGFVHHYQVSSNKIDCGGLDLTKLVDEINSKN